jgi:hypothetical protein
MHAMTAADWFEFATVALLQGLLTPYTWAVLLLGLLLAGLIDQLRPQPQEATVTDRPTPYDPYAITPARPAQENTASARITRRAEFGQLFGGGRFYRTTGQSRRTAPRPPTTADQERLS